MAHLFHLGPDGMGRIQGIGAGGLPDGKGRSRLSVIKGITVVAFGSEFGSPHVPDPNDGTVGIGAQRDRRELLGRFEQALDNDGGVQALSLYGRGPDEGLFLSEFKRGFRPKPGVAEKPLLGRLGLHAAELAFTPPAGEQPVQVAAPLPADLARALAGLRHYLKGRLAPGTRREGG